jgi:hypothetical protein
MEVINGTREILDNGNALFAEIVSIDWFDVNPESENNKTRLSFGGRVSSEDCVVGYSRGGRTMDAR